MKVQHSHQWTLSSMVACVTVSIVGALFTAFANFPAQAANTPPSQGSGVSVRSAASTTGANGSTNPNVPAASVDQSYLCGSNVMYAMNSIGEVVRINLIPDSDPTTRLTILNPQTNNHRYRYDAFAIGANGNVYATYTNDTKSTLPKYLNIASSRISNVDWQPLFDGTRQKADIASIIFAGALGSGNDRTGYYMAGSMVQNDGNRRIKLFRYGLPGDAHAGELLYLGSMMNLPVSPQQGQIVIDTNGDMHLIYRNGDSHVNRKPSNASVGKVVGDRITSAQLQQLVNNARATGQGNIGSRVFAVNGNRQPRAFGGTQFWDQSKDGVGTNPEVTVPFQEEYQKEVQSDAQEPATFWQGNLAVVASWTTMQTNRGLTITEYRKGSNGQYGEKVASYNYYAGVLGDMSLHEITGCPYPTVSASKTVADNNNAAISSRRYNQNDQFNIQVRSNLLNTSLSTYEKLLAKYANTPQDIADAAQIFDRVKNNERLMNNTFLGRHPNDQDAILKMFSTDPNNQVVSAYKHIQHNLLDHRKQVNAIVATRKYSSSHNKTFNNLEWLEAIASAFEKMATQLATQHNDYEYAATASVSTIGSGYGANTQGNNTLPAEHLAANDAIVAQNSTNATSPIVFNPGGGKITITDTLVRDPNPAEGTSGKTLTDMYETPKVSCTDKATGAGVQVSGWRQQGDSWTADVSVTASTGNVYCNVTNTAKKPPVTDKYFSVHLTKVDTTSLAKAMHMADGALTEVSDNDVARARDESLVPTGSLLKAPVKLANAQLAIVKDLGGANNAGDGEFGDAERAAIKQLCSEWSTRQDGNQQVQYCRVYPQQNANANALLATTDANGALDLTGAIPQNGQSSQNGDTLALNQKGTYFLAEVAAPTGYKRDFNAKTTPENYAGVTRALPQPVDVTKITPAMWKQASPANPAQKHSLDTCTPVTVSDAASPLLTARCNITVQDYRQRGELLFEKHTATPDPSNMAKFNAVSDPNNPANTLLAGSQWKLTTPAGTEVWIRDNCAACPALYQSEDKGKGQQDLVAANAAMALDQDPAPGKFQIDLDAYGWGTYTLVERSAPAGFTTDTSDVRTFTVSANNLQISKRGTASLINRPAPVPALPLTGGTSEELFQALGGIILVTSLILGWGFTRRSALRQLVHARRSRAPRG